MPIQIPEPGSLNARNTVTNVWVKCAWNHAARYLSGPAKGFAIATIAPFWGRMRAFTKRSVRA